MKQLILTFSITALQALQCHAQSGMPGIPDYPIGKGVSAPFAGFVNDWLIVGGGCNFPDTPAAQGGKKVYYSQCYAIDTRAGSPDWIQIADLPSPTAYGCSVETSCGLICIGGMNADSCLTSVYRIVQDTATGTFSTQPLPSLPEAIDNAAATAIGTDVYLTGGNQKNGGNILYRLSLSEKGEWQRLPSYPGVQRVQPILVNDSRSLFLIGGFRPSTHNQASSLSDDILRYDLSLRKWEPYSTIPLEITGEKRCMVGGSGIQTDAYLLLTGGVNYTIFKNAISGKAGKDYLCHEPSWYKFNDDILLFDFSSKQWKIFPDISGMARAGGVLLLHNHFLYMICGETKPGVRTPQISRLHWPEEAQFLKK